MPNFQKLSIIGGSSPFTIELINCFYTLSNESSIGPYELMLNGRNAINLERIFEYAKYYLSKKNWIVKASINIDDALDGASIVVHQNRYGGTSGRFDDEVFSQQNQLHVDETLGPSGLKSAIRMAPYLECLAKEISQYCPNAIVINLTNPLSLAVSLLHKYGVSNVIGICELPTSTAAKIATDLSIPIDDLEWDYTGLNHRGFIHNLKRAECNVLQLMFEQKLEGFNGFDISLIKSLDAVPLKYFHLLCNEKLKTDRRAKELELLSLKLLSELATQPYISPPSLNKRNMDWYSVGLIPVLEALNSNDARVQVLNKPNNEGITVESKASISKSGITTIIPENISDQVKKWNYIFLEHEKLALHAVVEPTYKNIMYALDADPIFSRVTSTEIRYSVKKYFKDHANLNFSLAFNYST